MKNLYRIGVNTFFDALREPVYALMLAVGILLIVNYPAAALYVFREQIKMVTDSSMATILAFSFLIPVLISGAVVASCIRQGVVLEDLPLGAFQAFSDRIGQDVYESIAIETCVRKRTSEGGTGPASVRNQIEWIRKQLSK